MSTQLRLTDKRVNRRRFLAITAGGIAVVTIGAACGGDDDNPANSTATMRPPSTPTPASTAVAQRRQGRVVVGDVLDHALFSEDWIGEFGFVTFKLHTASVDGEPAYFIRTDASDRAFADAERLVYVPRLASALTKGGTGLSQIYLVQNGTPDQPAVLSTAPHKPDYSPAFRVHRVTFNGQPVKLDSVGAIRAAEQAGSLAVEQTDIVVNYPVVKWLGGELPHDEKREVYLGDGQLLEPVDVANGRVTFKLHLCYPSLRYIVTDVTLPPMAEGMKIASAPGAAALSEAGATAKILVFGNGVKGSGPMGFQKSVVDTVVGDAAWSPYWDHFTFTWSDESGAEVLKSETAIIDAETGGKLKRFAGTPDTNGTLFMVNCPSPVVAPADA